MLMVMMENKRFANDRVFCLQMKMVEEEKEEKWEKKKKRKM